MNRIQNKLLTILVLVALVPLLVTEYLTIKSAEETQAMYKMDSLDSILGQKITLLDQHIIREQERAQLLANTPKIIQSLPQLVKDFDLDSLSDQYQETVNELTPFLSYYQQAGKLSDVYIIARNGNIVYSTRQGNDFGTNLTNGPYNRSQLASVMAQAIKQKSSTHSKFTHYAGDNNFFSAFVAAPIIDNNEVIGVIALQISPEVFYDITLDYTALQDTGETVLAKLNGDQAVFISPLRFNSHASNEVKVAINSANGIPIQEAVQGINGKGFSVDYRDVPIIAAWRYLPKYNLGMVVKIDREEAFDAISQRQTFVMMVAISIIVPFLFIAFFISRGITRPIIKMVETTKAITNGDLEQHIPITSNDEIGQLAASINDMSSHIQQAFDDREMKLWLQDGMEDLSITMRGNQISTDLADNIVSFVSNYLDAKVGSLYILKSQQLELIGGFAFIPHFGNQVIELGQGLIGQVAQSKKSNTLTNVPEDYASISSSLGEIQPGTLLVYPIMKEDQVIAVLELGWLSKMHERTFDYLDAICESVATGLGIAESHHRLQSLLDQSQQQMEELQVREEELRAINDEVEQRSTQLAQSQCELEEKSDELQSINDALEQKTESLERQNIAVEAKNKVIETARQELQEKAEQLEMSSQYKSEFLANMSHELRTPLNSMLILSRILYDNDDKNLDEDQVESAKVIHNSGQELLSLINDILDLSKIEAGKMETCFESVSIDDITHELHGQFTPIAKEKGLAFSIDVDKNIPKSLILDVQKTQQILKNLLSNSLKFTETGSVKLQLSSQSAPHNINTKLNENGLLLAISVVDTGIGISKEKQLSIFESFQQADGSTSRKYGGTGLGLTISRQLAALIGAELGIESKTNIGSKFTLYLPLVTGVVADGIAPENITIAHDSSAFIESFTKFNMTAPQDDVDNITSADNNIIVIIEDDPDFSQILAQLARKSGYKCAIADNGTQGIEYVTQYKPCGVILDLGLPDMSGVNILDILKNNPDTANIPIHVMSGQARTIEMSGRQVQGYHQKPVAQKHIDQILAQFRPINNQSMSGSNKIHILMCSELSSELNLDLSFLDQQTIEITYANSLDEVSHLLGNDPIPTSGIIINLDRLNRDSEQWFNDYYQMNHEINIPIILCLQQEPVTQQLNWLEQYSCHVIINSAQSAQRLKDEVELFLTSVDGDDTAKLTSTPVNLVKGENDISPALSSTIVPAQLPKDLELSQASHEQADHVSIKGCNVLLVDDDLRNTFALSKVLKKQGMNVILADNGQMALDKLEESGNIDIVLMDIMMPVMDGHEAMRQIRLQDKHSKLPIIALTAKAMQEDRRKCVEAGASDYLTKPVDVDKLVATMRVWLYQEFA
ncbi:MAG: response regulator [Gammaproteobacteria bacterium]|nr:response regulator [Gammaproteobacteria bacterium]